MDQLPKSEEEWRGILTPEQFRVLRQAGTERPFTGEYWDCHEAGIFRCAGCGAELFDSQTKFDSGCGWPSFYEALDSDRVEQRDDLTHGMRRVEVLCRRCGGHLGHVFPDAPQTPTGLRYCINSASLRLERQA